jgi:hypothetical protein
MIEEEKNESVIFIYVKHAAIVSNHTRLSNEDVLNKEATCVVVDIVTFWAVKSVDIMTVVEYGIVIFR